MTVPPDPPPVRLRLDVRYDGTGYAGWARQPDQPTICGALEDALARITRLPAAAVALTVAGRTDAGVHARGQVAHLDLPAAAWLALPGRSDLDPAAALLRRLGGVLPAAIGVTAVTLAPPGFDARFAALWRRYCYRIADRPEVRDPLRRGHVLWHRRALDEAAMNEACAALLGEHDFAAYCRPKPGGTTVRRLLELHWRREGDGTLACDVRADAFCHNMVRALVGGAIAVGEGRRDPGWPRVVLDAGRRDPGVTVMPAHGLTLEQVAYPPPGELAARARVTRARRD